VNALILRPLGILARLVGFSDVVLIGPNVVLVEPQSVSAARTASSPAASSSRTAAESLPVAVTATWIVARSGSAVASPLAVTSMFLSSVDLSPVSTPAVPVDPTSPEQPASATSSATPTAVASFLFIPDLSSGTTNKSPKGQRIVCAIGRGS